jgi:hypothetical protein
MDSSSWSLRMTFLQGLLRACVAAGALRDDTPIDLVCSALLRIFKAVAQEWVEGELSLDEARREIGVSYGLVLASLAADEGRAALDQARRRYGQPA